MIHLQNGYRKLLSLLGPKEWPISRCVRSTLSIQRQTSKIATLENRGLIMVLHGSIWLSIRSQKRYHWIRCTVLMKGIAVMDVNIQHCGQRWCWETCRSGVVGWGIVGRQYDAVDFRPSKVMVVNLNVADAILMLFSHLPFPPNQVQNSCQYPTRISSVRDAWPSNKW